MVNIILHMVLILCQCMILICLVRIKRYLRSIDSGQEETNEYLSDIRKMYKEAMSVETDETCSGLEYLSDFMGG